jgi:hypothetical protein
VSRRSDDPQRNARAERLDFLSCSSVMAGLVPAIHVLGLVKKDVDARHKAGHDGTV